MSAGSSIVATRDAGASVGIYERVVEASLEREQLFYTTRTVAGAGEGTTISTRLEPLSERRTRVEVEFFVAAVGDDGIDAVGAVYRFDVRTRRSADSCALRLGAAPCVEVGAAGDEVVLVWRQRHGSRI